MGSRIIKGLSPSEVGNAAFKATPRLPVVVLDFGDGQFDQAVKGNMEQRAERCGASVPYDSMHYFRCGGSHEHLLDVVNGVFESLKSDDVSVLYIRSMPRHVSSWVLAALSKRFFNVICTVARVHEETGYTCYFHELDLEGGQ